MEEELTEVFFSSAKCIAETSGGSVGEVIKPHRTLIRFSLHPSGFLRIHKEQPIAHHFCDLLHVLSVNGIVSHVMPPNFRCRFCTQLVWNCVIEIQ